MIVTHKIDIDLVNPGVPHRIQVKQGDVMSHSIDINLLEDGKAWNVSRTASAVIRYCAHNPDGMVTNHGLYDTLEDGSPAYLLLGNTLSVMPISEMTAAPGLVTVDVLLAEGVKKLATFNFEIYVNRAPNDGTVAENKNYYRVATLEAINAELNVLRSAITALGGGDYLT